MPLPIAHGLIGASVVALIHPNAELKKWKPLLIGFVLANCPDLDFVFSFAFGWHGFHRGLTHSLTFALLISAVIFIYLRRQNRRIPLAYSAAFLSHALLDFLCAKTGAVRLLMPFDNDAYALGLVSFSEITRGFLIQDMLYFSLLETAIFAPVFLAIIYIKRKTRRPQC